jgi:hypothetical protein
MVHRFAMPSSCPWEEVRSDQRGNASSPVPPPPPRWREVLVPDGVRGAARHQHNVPYVRGSSPWGVARGHGEVRAVGAGILPRAHDSPDLKPVPPLQPPRQGGCPEQGVSVCNFVYSQHTRHDHLSSPRSVSCSLVGITRSLSGCVPHMYCISIPQVHSAMNTSVTPIYIRHPRIRGSVLVRCLGRLDSCAAAFSIIIACPRLAVSAHRCPGPEHRATTCLLPTFPASVIQTVAIRTHVLVTRDFAAGNYVRKWRCFLLTVITDQ